MNIEKDLIGDRIQEIKRLLLYIADLNVWNVKVGQFVNENGGNFFIPTALGKSLLNEGLFTQVMSHAVTGAESRVYYCNTTKEIANIRASRLAVRRLGAWLIDAMQVFLCYPIHQEMSQLECWKEAERIASIVISKEKVLKKSDLIIMLRYFSRQEIQERFFIDNRDSVRFLAECGIEECSAN